MTAETSNARGELRVADIREDAREPLQLLREKLAHDEDGWAALCQLMPMLAAAPQPAAQQQGQAVAWVSAADIAPFVGAPQMAAFWGTVTLASGPGDGRTIPLYAAQQQGQAVAEDMGGFTSDTAALAFLHLIGNGNPNVERAVERLRQSLIAQSTQQGGGEVAAWETEDGRVISARQKATALRDGGASASSVAPYTTPLYRTAPPSAPDYPITATCRVCDYDYRCVPVPAKCGTCGSDLPPSAPVGVEELLADLETIWHSVSDDKETNAAYQRLKSALAQQPAAVDEARSGSSIMDGAVSFVEALAAQHQEPTT